MNKFGPKTQRATLWHRRREQQKSSKAFDDGNSRERTPQKALDGGLKM
jgi:hypothetical protein